MITEGPALEVHRHQDRRRVAGCLRLLAYLVILAHEFFHLSQASTRGPRSRRRVAFCVDLAPHGARPFVRGVFRTEVPRMGALLRESGLGLKLQG